MPPTVLVSIFNPITIADTTIIAVNEARIVLGKLWQAPNNKHGKQHQPNHKK